MSDLSIASRIKYNRRKANTRVNTFDQRVITRKEKSGRRNGKKLKTKCQIIEDNFVVNTDFDSLNDDCLRHILRHISFTDRFRCMRVCKRWQLLLEELLNNQMAVGMKNITYNRSQCSDHSIHSRHLMTSQDLIDCALIVVTEDELNDNEFDLRNAVQRSFNHCYRNLSLIFKRCPKLLSLDLRTIDLDDKLVDLISRFCPKLECLHLNSMIITDAVWMSLAHHLAKRLKHLNIRNSIQLNQKLLVEHFIRSCTQLKCLKVTEWNQNLNLKWFDCISESVEEIHISCTSANGFFKSFDDKNMTNVKHLKLSTFDTLNQLVIDTIGSHFVNLTKINLRNCEGFSKRNYRPIASLSRLKHLAMDLPFANCDEDFIHFTTNCTKMKSIELNFGLFTLKSLKCMAKYWPLLENLSFRCVSIEKLNTEALDIFEKWKHLRRLSLHGTNITDNICQTVQSMPSLRYLNLDLCNNISKAVVHSLIDLSKQRTKEWFELSVKETKIIKFNGFKNVEQICDETVRIKNLFIYYTSYDLNYQY